MTADLHAAHNNHEPANANPADIAPWDSSADEPFATATAAAWGGEGASNECPHFVYVVWR